MAASVASSFGPGFSVGMRRPIRFSGSASRGRARAVVAPLASPRQQVTVPEFAPVVERAPRSAPPMRRRFEAGAPGVVPPVSRRARRIDRPASGRVRVRPRVRRAPARSASYHPHAAPARLRLTRRGRLLLLVLAAVAVYAAFGLGRASAGPTYTPAHATTAVVQPGDSLWSIAIREFPHSDPRDVVGQLKSLNHLSTSDLAAGQKLRLP